MNETKRWYVGTTKSGIEWWCYKAEEYEAMKKWFDELEAKKAKKKTK